MRTRDLNRASPCFARSEWFLSTAATDCSVASVDVEVNENVNAGTTVATVNCGEQLEVELSIPERGRGRRALTVE